MIIYKKFIFGFTFIFINISPLYAEPLEVLIYLTRSASDIQHKTYTFDFITSPDTHKDFDINIVQNGSIGQMSSTFVRGTNADHTLFTFNGMSIKDHSTPNGVDDISQHSMLGVNSVEIVKGPMSTVYGPNAVGAVVNMSSYATEGNRLDFSFGSNGYNKQIIKVADYFGTNLIDFSASRISTDGISVYKGGAEKDGFDTNNYSFKSSSRRGHWLINTSINSTVNKSDLDNSGSDALNYTSEWKFNNQYIDAQRNKTKISYNHVSHEREYNKSGTIDTYDSESHNLLATHVFDLDQDDLTLGFELMQLSADFDTNIDGYVSSVDNSRENSAIFTSFNHLLPADNLITIGLRHDLLSGFDDVTTYRLGTYLDGIRMSYATAFKEPTAYEMYGSDNFGFSGNPDLKPESSNTFEIGYATDILDISFYNTSITNLLKYNVTTYINDSGMSVRKGADLKLRYSLDNLKLTNNTSYVVAEDSSGNELLRRPKWQNSLYAEYELSSASVVTGKWNYYGDHLDINSVTYATERQPSISTIDFGYSYIFNNYNLHANLNNITDLNYERPHGYNQLGRNFEFGLEYIF
jgi:vitamin B12 transporter